MDNFKIDVTCEKTKPLTEALALVMSQHSRLRGYRIDPPKEDRPVRMVLFWMEDETATPFPFEITRGDLTFTRGRPIPDKVDRLPWLVEMVEGWLLTLDYGREPDHDGDNGRGWRVYTNGWGHVDGDSRTACAIEPAWAMYGK